MMTRLSSKLQQKRMDMFKGVSWYTAIQTLCNDDISSSQTRYWCLFKHREIIKNPFVCLTIKWEAINESRIIISLESFYKHLWNDFNKPITVFNLNVDKLTMEVVF